MGKTYYIYALCEPDEDHNVVRYVGKSNDPLRRFKEHMYPASLSHHCHRSAWIKALQAQGLKPRLVILEETNDGRWAEDEIRLIAKYRHDGHDLTNTTDGGDGGTGYRFSKDSCAKRRASLVGRVVTPETRARMSEAARNRTPEHNAKIGEASRARASTTGPKVAAANRSRIWKDESRARLSASQTLRASTPEGKAQRHTAFKGQRHTEETREKIARSNSVRVVSPETKAKISASVAAYYAKRAAEQKIEVAA